MISTEKVGYHELTKTVSISEYKWTLYNFSSFIELPPGVCICSQTFVSNSLKWNLKLYPDGDKEANKGYISICLHCLNNAMVTVDCKITMSNSGKVYKSQKFKHTFQYNKTYQTYALDKFIDLNTVLTGLKETNDVLVLGIKISSLRRFQEANYFNLQEDLGLLLNSGENSDVVLVSTDEKKYKAHKAILACRSKVLSAMLQHNMKENTDNVIKIEGANNETLAAILYFVYTGELSPFVQDISNELLVAADKYELHELKKMCTNYLHDNMDFDSVLELIKIGDTYNISELKIKAKEYFLKNHTEILSTERRKNLKELPRDIIEDLLCDLSSNLSKLSL